MTIKEDGVNDENVCEQAFKKLEAEGFFEEVKRKYGLSPVHSDLGVVLGVSPEGSERQ
jgi:hypothetical protein